MELFLFLPQNAIKSPCPWTQISSHPMVLAFVLVSMVVRHVPKKLAGGCAGEGVVLGGVDVEGDALEAWPLVGEPDAEVTLVLFSNGYHQGSGTSGGERGERRHGREGKKGKDDSHEKGG